MFKALGLTPVHKSSSSSSSPKKKKNELKFFSRIFLTEMYKKELAFFTSEEILKMKSLNEEYNSIGGQKKSNNNKRQQVDTTTHIYLRFLATLGQGSWINFTSPVSFNEQQ